MTSAMISKSGKSRLMGRFWTEEEGNTRCVHHWMVENFFLHDLNEYSLHSESFEFGSGSWHLSALSITGNAKTDGLGVSICGPYFINSHHRSKISLKLSVSDSKGQNLHSTEWMWTSPNTNWLRRILHIASHDAWGLLSPNLDVRCELCFIPEETANTSFMTVNHQGTEILVRDFKKLLTCGESSDAIVRVKEERDFRVHRSILVARTPVFAAMFRHEMSEKVTGTVNITDCEPDIFERFLQHIYTGRVEDLCPENASSLYQMADKYQVDDLKVECLRCMKEGLSIASFCPILRLALQHPEAELTQLVMEFLAKNMREILVTVEWQNFLGENHIVANDCVVKALGASKTCN